jgi:molecular chaperone DnaK
MMIGIDFGTTNSGVAVWTPRGTAMIEIAGQQDTLPSVVAQTDKGFLRGREALTQLDENPDYTFRNIKRYLGRDFDEQEHSDYQLAEGPDGKVWWRGRHGLISGPGLVSELFKSLLIAAESHLKVKPTGAVIAVPVEFLQSQKDAVREAAGLVGLERVEMLEEPYAAAMAYGFTSLDDTFKRVGIYDLGGGTFDATILHLKKGMTSPVGMSGIGFLGGADFDARIVEHCADKFFAEHGIDLRSKPHCMVRLVKECEEAKRRLSDTTETTIHLPQLVLTEEKGLLTLKQKLKRSELEDMTKDLVARTVTCLKDALVQADLTKKEIEHVLLVGGQSRMPLIHAVLSKFFGPEKLVTGPRPEHAVALGAAIQAAEIEGRKAKSVLERIAPQSIGITRFGGEFVPVIKRGEKYPVRKTAELCTVKDGQALLGLEITQGEAVAAEDNERLVFHQIPAEALPAGDLTVTVTLDVDAGGQLSVMAGEDIILGLKDQAA